MELVALLDRQHDCIAGNAPACARACPLDIDVLGFIEKVRSGSFPAAYRLYTKNAVLPGIVCHVCGEPCKEACVRTQVDDAISLRDLEKFCWQKTKDKAAGSFFIPEKENRVLIVGAGPTGLSCAVKLAGRGYPVELVEKSDKLGGRLWDLDEKILPKEVLLWELDRIAQQKFLEIRFNTEVKNLGDFTFDVALLATGENGAAFAEEENIFLTGSFVNPGQSILHSIKQGADASYLLENYIKVQRRDTVEAPPDACPFEPQIEDIEKQERIPPANPEALTEAEAREEAKRCLRCSCNNCVDACEMFQYYKIGAKKMMQFTSDTVNKTYLNKKTALRQVMSCTQCGLCAPACPVDIDFKDLCLETRRVLHKAGQLPDAHYNYWIQDMQHANGEKAALVLPPSEKECRYLYFPGCQMGASSPEYVLESYRWLSDAFSNEVGLMLYCCGAPADWAGDEVLHGEVISRIQKEWQTLGEPVLVVSCPTCRDMFANYLPDIPTQSLWDMLAENWREPKQDAGTISVFDPCTSKNDRQTQESIRVLLEKAGYTIEELTKHGAEATCCGYGGLVYTTNPGIVSKIQEHNKELGKSGEEEFVTYCTNCRDSFVQAGKPSRHVLDVLFSDKKNLRERKPPDLSVRRENREELKRKLSKEVLGLSVEQKTELYSEIKVEISGELQDKMNRQLILLENIQKVIHHAQTTGDKIYNPAEDYYTAHLLQGFLTFWVQYKPKEDGYILCNVYQHRMKIDEV